MDWKWAGKTKADGFDWRQEADRENVVAGLATTIISAVALGRMRPKALHSLMVNVALRLSSW